MNNQQHVLRSTTAEKIDRFFEGANEDSPTITDISRAVSFFDSFLGQGSSIQITYIGNARIDPDTNEQSGSQTLTLEGTRLADGSIDFPRPNRITAFGGGVVNSLLHTENGWENNYSTGDLHTFVGGSPRWGPGSTHIVVQGGLNRPGVPYILYAFGDEVENIMPISPH